MENIVVLVLILTILPAVGITLLWQGYRMFKNVKKHNDSCGLAEILTYIATVVGFIAVAILSIYFVFLVF